MKNLLLPFSIGMALVATASAQVNINEIRIDQPSSDNDEFFELAAPAGTSLDGLFYIVIGDGAGGSGVVESISDLAGMTVGSSGYFLAGEGSMTIAVPDLVSTLGFENSDNVTHMLVDGFTGALQDDLDTDDDGIFDITPWNSIVDSVALVENLGSGDLVYSTTMVGPDGTYVPGHVSLFAGTWEIGNFGISFEDTPGERNLVETGTAFCDPASMNSTGAPVEVTGYFGMGVGSDLHLEANGGPDGQLCFFLVSGAANDPGIQISNGSFCLGGQFYRYSGGAGGQYNSMGLFDASGVMQNGPGTSLVGTGYDVASEIPASVPFAITAGNTWHFQAWYRDTAAGMGASNFSNGLSVTF